VAIKQIRKKVHKDSQLCKATDYLEYDVHTFVASLELYIQARNTPGAMELGNAAMDSFLLRARLLFDFLLRDNGLDDDVIAIDFFHDQPSRPYNPRMTKSVERQREKINKQLMHLTTRPMPRLRSNQSYALKEIVPPISKSLRAWLAVVPDSRLQQPAANTRRIFAQHLDRLDRLVH
jgi:hypothetical protein